MDERENFVSCRMPDRTDGTSRRHEVKTEHPCNGCFYYGGKTVVVKCCNYYLITGKRRPCEAGEFCTVRRDSGQTRRKAMTVKKCASK